jgi:hypothetical protein
MNEKQSAAFVVRMSQLSEAMVSGVLRALAARKEFPLPKGSIIGGCFPIDEDCDKPGGRVRISITFGENSPE